MNERSPPTSYRISTALFLRVLAAIYLIAFVSLWVQIEGLIGENGLLPIRSRLEWLDGRLGAGAYWSFPTLCWVDSSDAFLHGLCAGGTALALYATAFPFASWVWLALWALYLSLAVAGQSFLNFQWDALLLEVGLLAVFLAPFRFLPRWRYPAHPSRLALWMYRWLLFRFMILSGLVKIASRDAVWLDLSALEVHYMTQPLPPWTAWYVHHMPSWVHTACCGMMFFIELAVPFLIFLPRLFRLFGAALLIALQLVIIATGNYGFFNLLTIALCLLLIDDAFWEQAIARRFAKRRSKKRAAPDDVSAAESEETPAGAGAPEGAPAGASPGLPPPRRAWTRWVPVPVLALLFVLSLPPTVNVVVRTFDPRAEWFLDFGRLEAVFRPFRSVNGYGLFANMTEERPEIVIEGSRDGETWIAYEFKYKPGDPERAPGFVAPYMPRLDWQMWFAALRPNRPPWFGGLCRHLLLGTPEVLALIDHNPFPDAPPLALRAILYRYEFTSPEEKKERGAWWKRERLGNYLAPVSLRAR